MITVDMEDKQKIFLDKVIDILVRDTEIDYVYRVVKFPFISDIFAYDLVTFDPNHYGSSFSRYVTNTYGLTMDEDDYVWDRYVLILIDKFKNEI
jgi:hypothetical protein